MRSREKAIQQNKSGQRQKKKKERKKPLLAKFHFHRASKQSAHARECCLSQRFSVRSHM